MKTHCPICNTKLRPPAAGRETCGNSYCQEADHYLNAARNTRGKKAESAWRLALAKQRTAEERAVAREAGRRPVAR